MKGAKKGRKSLRLLRFFWIDLRRSLIVDENKQYEIHLPFPDRFYHRRIGR
jgi:hypothetical protein